MSKSKQQTEELSSVIAAELRIATTEVEQASRRRADLDQIIETAQWRLQTIESIWRSLPTAGIGRRDVERVRRDAENARRRGEGGMGFYAVSREARGMLNRIAAGAEKFAARVEGLLPASAK